MKTTALDSIPAETQNRYRQLQWKLLPLAMASTLCSCIVQERVAQRPHSYPAPRYYTPAPGYYAPPPMPPPPPRMVVQEEIIPVLPYGARVITHHGERCWYSNGIYYRQHPRLSGFIIFRP